MVAFNGFRKLFKSHGGWFNIYLEIAALSLLFCRVLSNIYVPLSSFHVNAGKKGNAAATYQKDDSSAKFLKAVEKRRKRG